MRTYTVFLRDSFHIETRFIRLIFFLQIDLPEFIQTKILRTLIRHLHFYLEVRRKGKQECHTIPLFARRYNTHTYASKFDHESVTC